MAERRMFAKAIVLSDAFINLSFRARCLYFTLGMVADDDGFVNGYKSVMRQIGVAQKDLNDLIKSRFVLPFKSGVIVITHWKINNQLRRDRYKETTNIAEKAELIVTDNNSYAYAEEDNQMATNGIPNGNQRYTQYSIVKDSIGKESIGKYNLQPGAGNMPPSEPVASLMLNDKTYHHIYQEDVDHYRELYPAVNIEQELRNMIGWLESNPTKRKTKSGIDRFINGWLSKNQNRGGTNTYEPERPNNGEFTSSESGALSIGDFEKITDPDSE